MPHDELSLGRRIQKTMGQSLHGIMSDRVTLWNDSAIAPPFAALEFVKNESTFFQAQLLRKLVDEI
jgi:hypothetical protein